MPLVLGFDPGGEGNFGWCIADANANTFLILHYGTVNHASAAVGAAMNAAQIIGQDVVAAGIDAPLFWIATGDREVDKFVRRALRQRGHNTSTVSAVNSLRGACLIQGMLSGVILRQRINNIPITEAHPKAARIIGGAVIHVEFPANAHPNDHENDAATAAYTAKAMLENNNQWHDIYPLEQNIYSLIEHPQYWIPI